MIDIGPILTCPNCNEPCEQIWVDSLGNDLCDNCWYSEDIEDINE